MRMILSGGGADVQVKETYELYAKLIDKEKPVLYIPIAMENADYESCRAWLTNELHQYCIYKIEMLTNINEILKLDLSRYSSIFIGGGNTYKLLSEFKESSAFDLIRNFIESDGLVFGGSAGAIILGHAIDSCSYDDENYLGLQDTTGYDYLNGYSICCHYDDHNFEKVEFIKSFVSKDNKAIALPEETSLYIDDSEITVVGTKPCTLFKEGWQETVQPNNKLKI